MTTEVEIVGGPEDGNVYVLFGDHHELSLAMSTSPPTPVKLLDNDTTPTFEVIHFPIYERPDGRKFINWWEHQ